MYACTYVKQLISRLGLEFRSEISFGVEVLMEINTCSLVHFTFVDENSLGSPSPTEATK